MPVTEESRHRLHQKLDQTIGPEDATTLMEHLPPTGWADLPTRSEMNRRFDDLRSEMNHRFDLVDQRFVELDRRFVAADRRQESLENRIDSLIHEVIRHTWQVVGFIAVIAGLLMAAAKYL